MGQLSHKGAALTCTANSLIPGTAADEMIASASNISATENSMLLWRAPPPHTHTHTHKHTHTQ